MKLRQGCRGETLGGKGQQVRKLVALKMAKETVNVLLCCCFQILVVSVYFIMFVVFCFVLETGFSQPSFKLMHSPG